MEELDASASAGKSRTLLLGQHSLLATLTDGLENDDYRGCFVAGTLHLTPFHGNLLVAPEPHPACPKLRPRWAWDPIDSMPSISGGMRHWSLLVLYDTALHCGV